MSRPALEIVRDYIHKVWNEQQVELVLDICANPITRHDPEKQTMLSHQDQIARITSHAAKKMRFTDVVLHGDAQFVTSVWDVHDADGAFKMSGIEVFKVTDGRISDVWNSTYMEGHWG